MISQEVEMLIEQLSTLERISIGMHPAHSNTTNQLSPQPTDHAAVIHVSLLPQQ
jgi:hypothetical protein